jgi:hypothetical protein
MNFEKATKSSSSPGSEIQIVEIKRWIPAWAGMTIKKSTVLRKLKLL